MAVDHLVVAAATLEQGAAWCEAALGVAPGPGGRHALFGTHNRLLGVATPEFPGAYLEIIAIDPAASPPQRRRWFALDDPALQRRLVAGPRLVHVVARTTAMDLHRRALLEAGIDPGDPVRASRETPSGTLVWDILVRADGQLVCAGAVPTLIRWLGAHPSSRMADSGVALRALELSGLPGPVRDALPLSGVTWGCAQGPALRARLSTRRGEVTLESP